MINTGRRVFRTPFDGLLRVRMTEDGIKVTIPRWMKLDRTQRTGELVAEVYQRKRFGLRAHSIGEPVDL